MKLKDIIYSFSGGDHVIIKQCDNKVQAQFLLLGLFVPLMFIICFISSIFTFNNVFENLITSCIMALFFSWMISNIYRLLLYTLAKNTLPHIHKIRLIKVSTMIRLIFVCFIAVLVSKPIEAMLYSNALELDITTYKMAEKKINHDKLLLYYRQQVDEIRRISTDENYVQDFIKHKEDEKMIVTDKMYRLIDASAYYLQRLKFLNSTHRSCWLITALLMSVFVFPIAYLKYGMNKNSYYNIKREIEKRIVDEAYGVFKKDFAAVFEKKHNTVVVYSEPYEDAPYNTIIKEDKRKFYTEEKFLSELYDA